MFEVMIKDPQIFKVKTEVEADAVIAALQKLKPHIRLQKLESEDVFDSANNKITNALKPGTMITHYPIAEIPPPIKS